MTGPTRSIKLVVAARAWNVELKKQVFPSLYSPAGLAPGPLERMGCLAARSSA